MLVAQTLKYALRCVSLLFDQGFVRPKDLIDHANKTIKRRATRRF